MHHTLVGYCMHYISLVHAKHGGAECGDDNACGVYYYNYNSTTNHQACSVLFSRIRFGLAAPSLF